MRERERKKKEREILTADVERRKLERLWKTTAEKRDGQMETVAGKEPMGRGKKEEAAEKLQPSINIPDGYYLGKTNRKIHQFSRRKYFFPLIRKKSEIIFYSAEIKRNVFI